MSQSAEASDEDCQNLLNYLTNSPAEIVATIAPDGWEHSPYRFIFHPTAQQIYEKQVQTNEILEYWAKKSGKKRKIDVPVLAEIEKELAENLEPIQPFEEFLDVLGSCLWCIFSNNHDVVDVHGTVYDLGSFRGSGRFIADFLNTHFPSQKSFGYLSFYCADVFLLEDDRAYSLLVLLFERLKKASFNWHYSFPRTSLVSFAQPEPTTTPENYDPEKALQQEIERKQEQAEVEKLQNELDNIYEQEKEEARYKVPPVIVRAYQAVYGCFPVGWGE